MKLTFVRKFSLLPLAGVLALSAQAQIAISTSSLNDGSVFTVSNSDLFQTSVSSVTAIGGFFPFTATTLPLLTDGAFGAANTDGTASVGPSAGTKITFAFNLALSPLGYNLTNLRTYAGWDSGRDGQE